jgi:hypothetical protein
VQQAQERTGSTWSPQSHFFEYIDFRSSPDELLRQYKSACTFECKNGAVVNGFACWIWCELSETGLEHRMAQTNYPYGAPDKWPRTDTSVDFSSLVDDKKAAGT